MGSTGQPKSVWCETGIGGGGVLTKRAMVAPVFADFYAF